MKRIVLIPTALATALAACAHNPARNLSATDLRPSVKVDVEERPIVQTDTVGRATNTDKAGNVTGYTDLTESHVVGRERYVAGYDLVRGDQVVDERDYFHLAGDDAAAKEIDSYRAHGVIMNRVGLAFLAMGAVGIAFAASGNDSLKSWGLPMYGLGIPVGGILAIMGSSHMKGHHLTLERALDAVGQPMPTLGPVGSLP